MPVGFAHGFLTLSESAEVLYKASGYWSKACERSLRWNDPDLALAVNGGAPRETGEEAVPGGSYQSKRQGKA